MASTLIQFRTDETEKMAATQVCEKLGLSLSTYLKACISRLIQERGIPFSMKLDEKNIGLKALDEANEIAAKHGISEMTLNEINAEIAEARK